MGTKGKLKGERQKVMCCSRWDGDGAREKTTRMGWASPECVWTKASSVNKNTEEDKAVFEIPLWVLLLHLSVEYFVAGGSFAFGVWDIVELGVWRWPCCPKARAGNKLWSPMCDFIWRDASDKKILWEISWSLIQADVFRAAERSLQCFVSAQLMRERVCFIFVTTES